MEITDKPAHIQEMWNEIEAERDANPVDCVHLSKEAREHLIKTREWPQEDPTQMHFYCPHGRKVAEVTVFDAKAFDSMLKPAHGEAMLRKLDVYFRAQEAAGIRPDVIVHVDKNGDRIDWSCPNEEKAAKEKPKAAPKKK